MKPDPISYKMWILKVWDVYKMEQIPHVLHVQRGWFLLVNQWSQEIHLLIVHNMTEGVRLEEEEMMLVFAVSAC